MVRLPRIEAGVVLAVASLFAATVAPVSAQDDWVGIGVGTVDARFDGPATVDFTARRGWTVGVFADVASPLSPVHVRVEGRWTRRGGNEATAGGGAERDLLGLPLAVGPRVRAGPVSLFPFAGIELAYAVAERRSDDIAAGFDRTATVDVGGFLGVAVDLRVRGTLRVGLDVRTARGLASAFDGPAGRLTARATELTLRLARPLT